MHGVKGPNYFSIQGYVLTGLEFLRSHVSLRILIKSMDSLSRKMQLHTFIQFLSAVLAWACGFPENLCMVSVFMLQCPCPVAEPCPVLKTGFIDSLPTPLSPDSPTSGPSPLSFPIMIVLMVDPQKFFSRLL